MPADLSEFLVAVGPLVAGSEHDLHATARQLLLLDELSDVPPGLSTLNNDGSPLELCLTMRPGSWKARLIGDPAFYCLDSADRFARSTQAIDEVFARAKAAELIGPAREALRITTGDVGPAAFREGVIWLASGVGESGGGAGIYIDARPHAVDIGWNLARSWLIAALPRPAAAIETIDMLATRASPASYSLEGTTLANGRAKVYFRLLEPLPLTEWGPAAFAHPLYLRFLALALRDRNVSTHGIVASVGFNLGSGDPADSKIDVCGHCLSYDRDAWQEVLDECARTFGLSLPSLAGTFEATSVAFIGLGLTQSGDPRLNLYLKPKVTPAVERAARVDRAAAKAVQYLMSIQSDDGSWLDFELPVGRSDQWVTAFVGYAMSIAGCIWPDARKAAERAADWLEEHRSEAAGWGFNASTGADADSTAFALALKSRLQRPVNSFDQDFLLEHWRPGGGFSTFCMTDAWGVAHPDVTPMAFMMLPEAARLERWDQLRDYLRDSRLASGEWPSYWWRNNSYATFAVSELLGSAVVFSDLRVDESNAFDIACATGAAIISGHEKKEKLLETLFRLQRADGAWSGGPNLRVTSPSCEKPWQTAEGDYYDDFRSTITTATALRALMHMRAGATVRRSLPS